MADEVLLNAERDAFFIELSNTQPAQRAGLISTLENGTFFQYFNELRAIIDCLSLLETDLEGQGEFVDRLGFEHIYNTIDSPGAHMAFDNALSDPAVADAFMEYVQEQTRARLAGMRP